MIRIDDVYQVGEVVTVGDLHGNVVYRSMLRTELELPDGSTAWVPNSSFQENQVLNHSRMGGWRLCVQVPLDCASDRAKATEVMGDVVNSLTWNSPESEHSLPSTMSEPRRCSSTLTHGSMTGPRSRGSEVCC